MTSSIKSCNIIIRRHIKVRAGRSYEGICIQLLIAVYFCCRINNLYEHRFCCTIGNSHNKKTLLSFPRERPKGSYDSRLTTYDSSGFYRNNRVSMSAGMTAFRITPVTAPKITPLTNSTGSQLRYSALPASREAAPSCPRLCATAPQTETPA